MLLAHCVWDATDTGTEADSSLFNSVLSDLQEELQADFWALWDPLDELQKKLLITIALSRVPTYSQMQARARHLIASGMINRGPEGWFIADPFFETWVQSEHERALVRRLTDAWADIGTRIDAARQLGRLGALEAIAAALADPAPTLRVACVEVLQQAADEAHCPLLAERLAYEAAPEVRVALIRALRHFGGPQAVETLLEAFDREGNEAVFEAIIEALASLRATQAIERLAALVAQIDAIDAGDLDDRRARYAVRKDKVIEAIATLEATRELGDGAA